MPDVLLMIIILLSGIISFFLLLVSFAVLTDSKAPKGSFLACAGVTIMCAFISYLSYVWVNAGDCKYDGYEYINVQRNGELKFYTRNGYIRQLDKTFNDKEYKIKLHKWSNQWCYGVYHTSKNSEILEFVPIDQKETVESNNTVDKK